MYMRGTSICVDGKNLFLFTDGGKAACFNEKQVVWKQELAIQNSYSTDDHSSVSTSSTPNTAFSDNKESVKEFVARHPEYLGDK
jgi:protein required for attachment to host cells